jgi:hypothetical protein
MAKEFTNKLFWEQIYKRAVVSEELLARARGLPARWHLLALNEDWCGDSVNILPYVAKLADAVPSFDLRIVSRDANLDIMDAHLTGKSRSIPVIILTMANPVFGTRPSLAAREKLSNPWPRR